MTLCVFSRHLAVGLLFLIRCVVSVFFMLFPDLLVPFPFFFNLLNFQRNVDGSGVHLTQNFLVSLLPFSSHQLTLHKATWLFIGS